MGSYTITVQNSAGTPQGNLTVTLVGPNANTIGAGTTGATTGVVTISAGTGGSYFTLVLGEGYLKRAEALAATAQEGIVPTDLRQYENATYDDIRSAFARQYPIKTTRFANSPQIVDMAELISSGRAINAIYAGDAKVTAYGRDLIAEGERAIERVLQGQRFVLDTAGDRIE